MINHLGAGGLRFHQPLSSNHIRRFVAKPTTGIFLVHFYDAFFTRTQKSPRPLDLGQALKRQFPQFKAVET